MPTRKSVCEDDRTTNPIQGQQQFKNKVDVGICESHRRTSLLVKRFSKMLPLHAINSMIFNFKIIEEHPKRSVVHRFLLRGQSALRTIVFKSINYRTDSR
ncbi:uncharacterized protein LOC143153115 isoform X2 [Ptiloglossa arizonensis]|uniref:uncharacterized protein LOC143153115 isoform X2 n=1 Tax=Ptiloglossa arizonensis TaxID=3350558 RepID=UPI003F9F04F9